MRNHLRPALLLALAALPSTAAATEPTEPKPAVQPLASSLYEKPANYLASADDNTFNVFWKDGIRFETGDEQFTAKIGGRIQFDWAFYSEDIEEVDPTRDFENGNGFRRARLYLEGTLYEIFEYKFQFDFAGGKDADFKDVYGGMKLSKQANIRVGQFYEPANLDELTSSNYISFIERSLVAQLAPSRSPGIMFHGRCEDERVTYAVGVFREDDSDNGNSETLSGEHAITGRVTGLPIYEDDGEKLVHAGASVSLRDSNNGMFEQAVGPSSTAGTTPDLLFTDPFAADDSTQIGLEAAGIFGPFWAQAEYMMQKVDADDGMSDMDINGHYLAAGYYVTGEHRRYKKSSATFDKTKVKRPYGEEGGRGALEVLARYAYVEFEDLRNGGTLFDDQLWEITLGINWYLNTNVRVQFNWVNFDLDADSAATPFDESGSAFVTRFHFWV